MAHADDRHGRAAALPKPAAPWALPWAEHEPAAPPPLPWAERRAAAPPPPPWAAVSKAPAQPAWAERKCKPAVYRHALKAEEMGPNRPKLG